MYEILINGELYHHGVKGQRWGVRKKYYKSNGNLTRKGKKIKRISDETVKAAKQHIKYAKKDKERLMKLYNKENKKKITDEDIRDKMRKDYGNDSKDKRYMNDIARNYGYKNANEYIKSTIKDERNSYKKSAENAKKYIKRCEEIIKKYSNDDISKLSKEDIKLGKEISKTYYSLSGMTNKYHPINIA